MASASAATGSSVVVSHGAASNTDDACPFCGAVVPRDRLNGHVNAHLDDQEAEASLEMALRLEQLEQQQQHHRPPDASAPADLICVSDTVPRAATAATASAPVNHGKRKRVEASGYGSVGLDGLDSTGTTPDAATVVCHLAHCQATVPLSQWDEHIAQHDIELAQCLHHESLRCSRQSGLGLGSTSGWDAGSVHKRARRVDSDSGTASRALDPQQPLRLTSEDRRAEAARLTEQYGTDSHAMTEGLLEGLCAACQRQIDRQPRRVRCTFLLTSRVTHFQQNRSDGGFACGYRNLQIVCSHLMNDPAMAAVLFYGCKFVPTLPCLQALLERAWKQGFDPIGAAQLGNRVVGTRKWIGTTEVCCVLRMFGVGTRIIDFYASSGKDGQSPHAALVDWVWRYFSPPTTARKASATAASGALGLLAADPLENTVVVDGTRPPLYFQHQGHSRTIVGIERRQDGDKPPRFFLLLLDPGCPGATYKSHLAEGRGWERLFKRGVHTLRMKQYQLVQCTGIIKPGTQEHRLARVMSASEVHGKPPPQKHKHTHATTSSTKH
eukprot:m.110082 g.110082  ORF g.110082 m.110082 type:complete len:552 (-) comp16017_c0_seq2:135-1790(-)